MTARATTALATLAAAAVAGVATGVLVHTTTRVTPSAATVTSTGTASPPVRVTTSRPPSPATATTTPGTGPTTPTASTTTTRPRFSVHNLMVANDYLSGGFSDMRVLTTGPGPGQAGISACQQEDPSQAPGLRTMFSGFATDSRDRSASQWVLQFDSPSTAVESVSSVVRWRTDCTTSTSAYLTDAKLAVGPVHQARLSDESEGQWWDLTYTPKDGAVVVEEILTARTGTRVTVVVLRGGATELSDLRPDDLLRAAVARLG